MASSASNRFLSVFLVQATDAGFTANWAADFSSLSTTGAEESANVEPAADGQGWPPAEGWPTAEAAQPQEEAAADEVRAWDSENNLEPNPERDPCDVGGGEAKQHPGQGEEGVDRGQSDWATNQVEWAEEKPVCGSEEKRAEGGSQSMPGIIFTNEFGQEIQDATEGELRQGQDGEDGSRWGLSSQIDLDGSGSEYETAEEWGDVPGYNGGWVSADDELESAERGQPVTPEGFADWSAGDVASEQITADDSGFGGDAFATSWDHPCIPDQTQNSSEKSIDDIGHSEANATCDVLQSTQTSDPFNTEGSDPFGTGTDPFSTTGEDPFGTGNDPFASSDNDPFGQCVTDSLTSSEQEPNFFSGSDPFASEAVDLFASQGDQTMETEQGGLDSDPFAETQAGWASDPFASEFPSDPFATEVNQDPFANSTTPDPFVSGADPSTNQDNQEWAGAWETTGTNELNEEGKDDDKSAQANGWAAFPAPPADSESSSKGSWQEVSDSSGFFSSDGQGTFTSGWPSETGQTQDTFASFPACDRKVTTPEEKAGHRELENSDLSEDEVANRRYGKLYQEIDTELEEVPDLLALCLV